MREHGLQRCPICRARPRGAEFCPRCGSRLGQLERVALAAEAAERAAARHLEQGRTAEARAALADAAKLRRSSLGDALTGFAAWLEEDDRGAG